MSVVIAGAGPVGLAAANVLADAGIADTPEQFARFVAAESEKMRRLVQVSGARVD